MKKMLLAMVMLLSVVALVNAEEMAQASQDMGITVDLSWTSKYIWRGFDVLDDTAAFQPSVNFDLGGGFSANVWMSYAGAAGTTETGASRVNATEYDYTLAYDGTVLEDSALKTNYQIGWRYYDYIDTPSKDNDVQEVFLTGSMPALTGCGAVPHFGVFQMWEAQQGDSKNIATGRDYSGTIYLMGFGYDFALDQAPELPMTFTWDIVYNDGTGGSTIDHDWSHMVWGLSTSMTCPMGGKITPSVYFQNSFEDTVNTQDELWANISYSFSF